jgi:predicted Fe-Mo cluster-binding NifX family protein
MKIAVPSEVPGGLEATVSQHFGHCPVFTMVSLDSGEVKEVEVVANVPHQQGGCMAPVNALKDAGAQALVAGGMGMRPLAGFQSVGIEVFFNEGAPTVADAIRLVSEGKARVFGPAQTCGGGEGHEGGCGNH